MTLNFRDKLGYSKSRENTPKNRLRDLVDQDKERFNIGPLNAPEQVLNFYFNTSFLEILKVIDSLKDEYGFMYATVKINGRSVSMMSLESRLNSLKLEIEKEIQDYYDLCKIYLIYAVAKELHHEMIFFMSGPFGRMSDFVEAIKSVLYTRKYKKLIEKENTKRCVAFMRRASRKFLSHTRFIQHSAYGGKNWASIADLGARMWSSEKFDPTLLDRLNQIEHNCGSVFTKNNWMFYNVWDIKLALDLKFKSRNLQEIIDGIPEVNDKIGHTSTHINTKNNAERVSLLTSVLDGLGRWANNPNDGHSTNSDIVNKINFAKAFLK